jgi:hypothetical protein
LENRQTADQLSHPALELIASRPNLFSRQGYLRATFRRRHGKTFGPYYLLCCIVSWRPATAMCRTTTSLQTWSFSTNGDEQNRWKDRRSSAPLPPGAFPLLSINERAGRIVRQRHGAATVE